MMSIEINSANLAENITKINGKLTSINMSQKRIDTNSDNIALNNEKLNKILN